MQNGILGLTLSVASALLVPLGQVLRHSEPALCFITCVPRLAAAVTTGTACGDQDPVTCRVGDGSAPQPILYGTRKGEMAREEVVGYKGEGSGAN